jgi:CPA2 family monovalent cation:H+ antiporter-2
MVAIGYGVGKAMGWKDMDSLFLGGILSISSTTIIIRALEELGLKTKAFATLVFGALIVEDLVAIVLMVLLSTLALSQQFAGTEMLFSILKLIFFLVIWFLMGIFFIPTLLRRAKKFMNDEMLLIISITLCFGMVVFAYVAGFSPALGAFVMGSILAETTKAEKIEHLVKPVKDLFGAIFFVSVGMLIDPAILVEYALPIVILCLVTIFGKIFATGLGALVSGQSLQTSVQAGFSMAQIGEFSFIIATLGLSLKVTSDFLYPLAVAVSAVTTLTTPYLIRSSGAFYSWLNAKLPKKITDRITRYSSDTRKVSHTSEWRKYIQSSLITSFAMLVLLFSIIIVSSEYAYPWISRNANFTGLKIITCLVTILILSPFIWAFAIRDFGSNATIIIIDSRYDRLLSIIRFLKLGMAALLIGFLIHRFFNLSAGIISAALIVGLLVIFTKRIQQFYGKIEERFISNLNQREIAADRSRRSELAPWDAHIASIIIASDASCVGKTLLELQWRERAGINVVLIKRGDKHIVTPSKEERIFPGDELLVVGTDPQIQRLKALIRPQDQSLVPEQVEVELFDYLVIENSPLIGKSIRETGLRENASALVVGIERKNERILNPESTFVLQQGDLVFIVGNRRQLKTILPGSEKH